MGKREGVTRPRRGEVYLVSFDPTVGSEIRKTRPALVLQNDVSNRLSPLTIVAAISSKFRDPPYPTDVLLRPPDGGLDIPSAILLNQIRSVDKRRLLRRLGTAHPATMERVDRALLISLGLIDL